VLPGESSRPSDAPLEHWLAEAFHIGYSGSAILAMDLRIVQGNAALARLLDRALPALAGADLRQFLHPDDAQRTLARVALLTPSARSVRIEHRLVRPDGSTVWVEQTFTHLGARDGGSPHLLSIFLDITERKRERASLDHQVFHDSLTGLPNRALLQDRIDHAVARSERVDSLVHVLFLDVDRFKSINDGSGHAAGDELLAGLAHRLRGALRGGDTLARYGGDEFVVVCEDGQPGDGEELAARIELLLREPFDLSGREVTVSASIGIARARPGDDASTMLRNADAAMYRAKQGGRARSVLFDDDLQAEAAARIATETDLRGAIAGNELVLHYQPIFDLAADRVVALEALVRWERADGVLLHPGDFLSVAEHSGMILPMGEWLLDQAIAQVGSWARTVPGGARIGVTVNLSARQFTAPTLAAVLARAIAAADVPASAVRVEIAEDVIMDDVERSQEICAALRAVGVSLAIDDFGTGYSSLSRLRRLPIDALKIDRGLIAGLTGPGQDRVIVRAIISLAKALSLEVVAEGVESEEQREILASLGCDQGQGFLWQRPMPIGAIEDWLSARPATA
jgi:diguanylate cyclase (GGDEF)-like protein/PAS domain S-box-containing protein